MTDKDSFETVELIKPVSLMQIDGSDLADAKDEAKAAQVPAKTAGKIADNAVTVSAATDIDTKTDAGYQADHSAEKILVDPKKLFGNTQASGEKQDYQKHNYAARFFIICVIGLILLLTIITVRSFKDKVEQTGSYSNYNTMLVAPVYTEIEFNADDIDLDLPVIISHKCIEYTDSGTRGLFFTATPTEENIGTIITVTMMDKRGNILGVASNSNCDVAVGDEYMIPMYFNLSPEYDMNGVTYKIKAETYKVKEYPMIRTITDVTEAGKGQFLITYEGTPGYTVTTYVVLYKDGDVVDVLVGTGLIDETGEVVIDASKAVGDYDSYKVYY